MKKWLTLLLAGLMCVSALTACGESADKKTETETEAETTYRDLPRFDYMNANMSSRVELAADVYASMNLEIPADLEITDKVVEDYIFSLRLNKRVPTYQAETDTETDTETETETETDTVATDTDTDAVSVAAAATEAADESATEAETEDPSHVKDQPLRLGDDAYIYYKGLLNGVAFEGGSNMADKEPTKLTLGAGKFIPGFEEGLEGVIPNQTSKDEPYELHVTFPENYGSAELAGKAVIFEVVVEYAVQYEVPAFDKDFVLTAMAYKAKKDEAEYADETELLEEYRAYVRETLEKQVAADVDDAKSSAMWAYLLDKAVCRDLPEEEVNYYYGQYLENMESNYDYYGGMYGEYWTTMYPTLDSYAIAAMQLEKGADWKAELAKQAMEPVKRDMIMYAVAEREGMKNVTDEEINNEIQYYIDYYKSYNITKTREDIIEEVGEAYIRTVAFQIKMDGWFKEKCTFTYGE